ncbi:MAG: hypothetical protein ACMXYG_04290 [Candidatus Woesearchaeota archaeon]
MIEPLEKSYKELEKAAKELSKVEYTSNAKLVEQINLINEAIEDLHLKVKQCVTRREFEEKLNTIERNPNKGKSLWSKTVDFLAGEP